MKLNPYLLRSTVVAALGGLLFGFDTAVIAGATQRSDRTLPALADCSGITVSSALFGHGPRLHARGHPGRPLRAPRQPARDGRALRGFRAGLRLRLELDRAGVVSAFIGGLAIGGSSVLGPMYIAEIAPAKWRGRLVGFFQFNVVVGILMAYFSNYMIGMLGFGAQEWRWKLGVAGVPAGSFFLMLFAIPRSPRWLVKQGRIEEAREVLRLTGEENYEQELQDIVESIDAEHGPAASRSSRGSIGCPFFWRITIGMFNQLPASTRFSTT